MTNDPEGSVDRLREQVAAADVLTDADREAVPAFSDQLKLLQSKYSPQRHEKLPRHRAITAGLSQQIPDDELPNVELHKALEDRDVAEELVRWIHDRYDADSTRNSIRWSSLW